MGIKFQMIPWSYLMGNHMCRSGFISEPAAPSRAAVPIIKVIKSDGMVKIYDRPINVSALTVKFPKHKVCSSDSLYIGQKISALPEDDELQLGHTYFLLPIHFFQSVLTFVTVTSFAASKAAASSNCQLFEIQKTESGFLRIRVREEFISRLMMMRKAEEDDKMITKMMMTNDNNKSTRTGTGYNTRTNIEKEKKEDHHQEEENSASSSSRKNKKNMLMSSSSNNSRVCTTPELQKEYSQLVLIGRRRWKPKLDMIKESQNSEKKSSISSSSRKVLLIPASFRLKKRSSSSSITSTTRAPTDNNMNSSNSKSSSRSHKTKKKKSSRQSSSEPPPPAHHVPITSSTSTTTTTASTKPPPAATKHKVKSSKRVYS